MEDKDTQMKAMFMIDPSLFANYYALVEIVKYVKGAGKGNKDVIFPFTFINRFRTDLDPLIKRAILSFLDVNKVLYDNLLYLTQDYYLRNFENLIREIEKSMFLVVSDIENIPVYGIYSRDSVKYLSQHLANIFYDTRIINIVSEVVIEELSFLLMNDPHHTSTNEDHTKKEQKMLPLILAFTPRNILIFEEIGIPIIYYSVLREILDIREEYEEKVGKDYKHSKERHISADIKDKIHKNFREYICKLFEDHLHVIKKISMMVDKCILEIEKYIHTILKNIKVSKELKEVLKNLNLTKIRRNFIVVLPIRYHNLKAKTVGINAIRLQLYQKNNFLFILIPLEDFLQLSDKNRIEPNTISDE